MGGSKVELLGICKKFKGAASALDRIDLSVAPGEFIVLVGPSGCGKSTLLRTIAGLEIPTSGSIRIGGRDVTHLTPADRGIGMVFQDYALYPHMNVAENLAFGLKIQGVSVLEIRKRTHETAEMLELTELLERRPSQLSGGQRQRVAIGRALIKRPSVLLLDEPLSNLDAQLRRQTRLEIAALHRKTGSTILYVTHDQEEAMTLADRVVLMKEGRILQVDTPHEIYQRPKSLFVASFIGTPQMNFLQGELRKHDGSASFQVMGQSHEAVSIQLGKIPLPESEGQYTMGFRPEAATLAEQGLPAQVIWVEQHGHENHLILRIGSAEITLRAQGRERALTDSLQPGAVVSIHIRPDQFQWFNTEGMRMDLRPRVAAA